MCQVSQLPQRRRGQGAMSLITSMLQFDIRHIMRRSDRTVQAGRTVRDLAHGAWNAGRGVDDRVSCVRGRGAGVYAYPSPGAPLALYDSPPALKRTPRTRKTFPRHGGSGCDAVSGRMGGFKGHASDGGAAESGANAAEAVGKGA